MYVLVTLFSILNYSKGILSSTESHWGTIQPVYFPHFFSCCCNILHIFPAILNMFIYDSRLKICIAWPGPAGQSRKVPGFILQSFKRKRRGFIHVFSFLNFASKDVAFNSEEQVPKNMSAVLPQCLWDSYQKHWLCMPNNDNFIANEI